MSATPRPPLFSVIEDYQDHPLTRRLSLPGEPRFAPAPPRSDLQDSWEYVSSLVNKLLDRLLLIDELDPYEEIDDLPEPRDEFIPSEPEDYEDPLLSDHTWAMPAGIIVTALAIVPLLILRDRSPGESITWTAVPTSAAIFGAIIALSSFLVSGPERFIASSAQTVGRFALGHFLVGSVFFPFTFRDPSAGVELAVMSVLACAGGAVAVALLAMISGDSSRIWFPMDAWIAGLPSLALRLIDAYVSVTARALDRLFPLTPKPWRPSRRERMLSGLRLRLDRLALALNQPILPSCRAFFCEPVETEPPSGLGPRFHWLLRRAVHYLSLVDTEPGDWEDESSVDETDWAPEFDDDLRELPLEDDDLGLDHRPWSRLREGADLRP